MTSSAESGLEQPLLIQRLRDMSAPRREGQLLRFLRGEIAARLLLDEGDIDGRAPLMSLGMSSLQVMEIKLLLERQLALPLPSSLVFDYPTLALLVPRLLQLAELAAPENQAFSAKPSALGPTRDRPGNVLAELAAELAELRDRS